MSEAFIERGHIQDGTNVSDIQLPSIDWQITNRCNLTCNYCYSQKSADGPVELRSRIAEAIARSSAKAVTFCGGEPLTIGKELIHIAQMLKDSGKITILNTNGMLFDSVLMSDLSNEDKLPFDIIGISMDGATNEWQSLMRGKNADIDHPKKAAEEVKQMHIRLKIATMLGSKNLDGLADLAQLVHDLQPDVWRIYRYAQRGENANKQQGHVISVDAFNAAVKKVRPIAAPVPVFPSMNESEGSCFIINSEGNVVMPHGTEDTVLANCLDTPIDGIWKKYYKTDTVLEYKKWIDAILKSEAWKQ